MRKKNYSWYRHPRTTQEARANQSQYVRAKRRKNNLPHTYDDIPVQTTNCWKDKRKTQYRVDRRGKKRQIYIESPPMNEFSWIRLYRLEFDIMNYLKERDIPHNIKPEIATEIKIRYITGRWVLGAFQEYEKPIRKEYKFSKTKGYTITWWSNKDIGLEYFLRKGAYSELQVVYRED